MIRILHDTKYDFIKWWKTAAILTAAFIAIGLGSLAVKGGFDYSIEFTGGTLMQVAFTKDQSTADIAKLRDALSSGGARGAEIQQFGSAKDFTIRAQNAEGTAGAEVTSRAIEADLVKAVGAENFKIGRTEAVGARVGDELTRGAYLAILISFGVTMLYLAWRFEWRFGLAAVIATAHDILTTIAFMKLLHLEISLTVVAALLTVLGYSLNDTIIIFDRVRENLRKNRKEALYDVLNRSVNETLPRSILTHATTFAATLSLLFFAGEVIRPFAWVMAFGIFTGTFSSIYVASPILLWIEQKYPRAVDGKKPVATKPSMSAPARG
jgi:preprotein translocase subunit SecF